MFSRIRDLREDKDKGQKEIAAFLNISEMTYRRYEKGQKDISLENALKLSEYYKVSLDYIAGRTNDKRGLTRSEIPEEQAEILRGYGELSDKRKGELLGVLRQLRADQREENAKRKDVV